jgi:hypothetical protein
MSPTIAAIVATPTQKIDKRRIEDSILAVSRALPQVPAHR